MASLIFPKPLRTASRSAAVGKLVAAGDKLNGNDVLLGRRNLLEGRVLPSALCVFRARSGAFYLAPKILLCRVLDDCDAAGHSSV